jgi:hypothetical protein
MKSSTARGGGRRGCIINRDRVKYPHVKYCCGNELMRGSLSEGHRKLRYILSEVGYIRVSDEGEGLSTEEDREETTTKISSKKNSIFTY